VNLSDIEGAFQAFIKHTEATVESVVAEGEAFASSPVGQSFITFARGFLAARGVTPDEMDAATSVAHDVAKLSAALEVAQKPAAQTGAGA